MQLHRLRLAAIGPFAGEHEIDFVALAAGGIFLLEGPTGAGKSTLIDAIVYALYGDVAGATASKDRIRSGFAESGTESYVDLVFESSSGIYRVRRSPEWQRPKKRGEGFTKEQAKGSLWRLTSPDDPDGGEHVSARLDEIGAEIERAVGLSRAQFVQTIVLPQGEFATFLKAKPEERRQVLQRVFGTQDYERVQDELLAAKKGALARVGEAQREVEHAVAGLCGVLGPFEDERVPESLTAAAREGNGLEDLVAEQVAIAEAARDLATERVGRASGEVSFARTRADRVRARRDAAERVIKLHGQRSVLLETGPEQEARLVRVAAARRAATVIGAIAGVERALAAKESAERALVQLEVEGDLRVLDRAGLTAARDDAQRAAGGLADAVERAEQSARRSVARDEKQGRLVRLEASMTELEQRIAEQPVIHTALTERMRAVQPLAEGLGKAEVELQHAVRRLTAAAAVATARVELVEAQADVARLAAEAAKRVEEEARLRTLRITGIAGELARGLTDGEACRVCGSAEHPAPAALSPDHADEEQVAAAEADRVAADHALTEAKAVLNKVEARLAGLQAEAGDLDAASADAAHEKAKAALEAAQAAVVERQRVEKQIAEESARDKQLQVERGELATQIAGLRSEITAIERQLTEDAAALKTARGNFETVELRLEHLESRCAQADSLLTAQDRLAEAVKQHAERVDELTTALAEQGFTDATAVRESSLAAAELTALEEAITAYRDELTRVAEALADPALAEALREPEEPADDLAEGPEVIDLAGLDPATVDPVTIDDTAVDPATLDPGTLDLDAMTAATAAAAEVLAQAESLLRQETETAAVAEQRAKEGRRCRDGLAELLAATATVREATAPVIRMADLATGGGPDNPRRLTLATYVLLRRFEEVVAVANERLAVMSDGRYALERSDERESGGGLRQGLALRVRDHAIDDVRDPHTLSGGETFYVSLCLALALAQVVTAEAGGVDLGTLFVDEGFGTLDPHVLEAVLSQLGALHAEGRVVGIISHVAELKGAIAERIEVRPTPDGPSTLTVVA